MFLEGANGPQHVGNIVLGKLLPRLPLLRPLLSLLPIWLRTGPCFRCLACLGLTLHC